MRTMTVFSLTFCFALSLSCSKKPEGMVGHPPAPLRSVDMLDATLSQWRMAPGSWEFKDGILARTGKGDLWSRKSYGNFILELEYKIPADSNSGILFRCSNPFDWINTALEAQIHVSGDGTVHGQCAGIYDCISPDFVRIAGLEVTSPSGARWELPLVDQREQKLADGGTITILKMYNNFQIAKRDGREVPYEGSQSKSNPAAQVLLKAPDGTEDKQFAVGDKPVKTSNGYTVNYRLEKIIAEKDTRKPADEWNSMKLKADGTLIEVELNGRTVLTMDLDRWTTAGFNPDGTKNKYAVPLNQHPRTGFIGLQDHGLPVWFRNVKMTVLPES